MTKHAFKRVLPFGVVALIVSLTSGWTEASVFLIGTPEGKPGDEVELSLAATAGTTLDSIDIVPAYDRFGGVLTLLDFQATPALVQGNGGVGCPDGVSCAIFYIEGKSFPKEAILATWRFRVADDAWAFADANGEIPFDLGVGVGPDLVPLPVGQAFRILAVPEPSSQMLVVLGVVLLVRRLHTLRVSGA